jgi:hypothetical protein
LVAAKSDGQLKRGGTRAMPGQVGAMLKRNRKRCFRLADRFEI